MFSMDGYSPIQKKLDSIFRKRVIFYKVKESPWGRVYHVIAGGNKFLLKVGSSELDHTGVYNEFKALRLLRKEGIVNVPAVRYFSKIRGQYFLLLDFVSNAGSLNIRALGEVFGRIHNIRERSHKRDLDTFMKRKIDYLHFEARSLAQIMSDRGDRRKKVMINHIERMLSDLERVLIRSREWFRGREGLSFLNNDNSDNILTTADDMIVITDWHLAGFGDSAWDLARLFAYYKIGNLDMADFFRGYFSFLKEMKFLRERIRIYSIIDDLFYILYNCSDEIDLIRYKNNYFVGGTSESKILDRLLEKKIVLRLEAVAKLIPKG